jgi:hypothetical protein
MVGFEVLMAVSTKMAVVWVVAPCSLVEVGLEVLTAVSMKIAVFIVWWKFTNVSEVLAASIIRAISDRNIWL